MIGRDGVAGLIGLGAALWALALSRGVPHSPMVPIGPIFYPRILFVVTALLSAALVAADVRARRRRRAPGPAGVPVRYRLVVITFAIFAAYVAALPWLGYRVATFFFVGGLATALEPPRGARWAVVAALAVLTTVATYLVFETYLSVLLPRGRLTGF